MIFYANVTPTRITKYTVDGLECVEGTPPHISDSYIHKKNLTGFWRLKN